LPLKDVDQLLQENFVNVKNELQEESVINAKIFSGTSINTIRTDVRTVDATDQEQLILLETVNPRQGSVCVEQTSSQESATPVVQGLLLFRKEIFLAAQIVDVMQEDPSIICATSMMGSVHANPRSREEDAMNLCRPITTLHCINTSMRSRMEELCLTVLPDSVTTSLSSQDSLGEDTQVSRTSCGKSYGSLESRSLHSID